MWLILEFGGLQIFTDTDYQFLYSMQQHLMFLYLFTRDAGFQQRLAKFIARKADLLFKPVGPAGDTSLKADDEGTQRGMGRIQLITCCNKEIILITTVA